MTTDDDKAWIRSWPLLLTGGILFGAGALIFFQKGDTTASIATMTVGVVLVSMWAGTEIVRIHEERKQNRDGDGQI